MREGSRWIHDDGPDPDREESREQGRGAAAPSSENGVGRSVRELRELRELRVTRALPRSYFDDVIAGLSQPRCFLRSSGKRLSSIDDRRAGAFAARGPAISSRSFARSAAVG
jgi:hypothetical protein